MRDDLRETADSETDVNITSKLLPKQVVIYIGNEKCIKSLLEMWSGVY